MPNTHTTKKKSSFVTQQALLLALATRGSTIDWILPPNHKNVNNGTQKQKQHQHTSTSYNREHDNNKTEQQKLLC